MAVLNAILLVILLPRYGIVGAAYAYLISVLPVFYFFYYVETKHLILTNRKNHYIKTILGTLLSSAIVFTINIFLGKLIFNLFSLLIVGGISAVLYVAIYKVLGFFEDEDWNDIKRFSLIILRRIIPKPIKQILKKVLRTTTRSVFYVKRKAIKTKRRILPHSKDNSYSFAILCVKKTVYADMAIDNINSLHYFNPHHTAVLYCDNLCFKYLTDRKNKFDYPQNITLLDKYGSGEKPWQDYKIDVHIQAAWNDQIDTDADEVWHESPIIDKKKITTLVKSYEMSDNERDVLVMEKIFNKKEWGKFTHYVAAFVSLPKEFMTEKIAHDLKYFNDAIFNHPLDFLEGETLREDTRRLAEEFAVNLAIQTNFPPEMITTLKKDDPFGSKKTLQSLYYGAINRVIE